MVGDRSPMKPAWATGQLAASKTAKGFMHPNNIYIYIYIIYIYTHIYIYIYHIYIYHIYIYISYHIISYHIISYIYIYIIYIYIDWTQSTYTGSTSRPKYTSKTARGGEVWGLRAKGLGFVGIVV